MFFMTFSRFLFQCGLFWLPYCQRSFKLLSLIVGFFRIFLALQAILWLFNSQSATNQVPMIFVRCPKGQSYLLLGLKIIALHSCESFRINLLSIGSMKLLLFWSFFTSSRCFGSLLIFTLLIVGVPQVPHCSIWDTCSCSFLIPVKFLLNLGFPRFV